MSRILNNYIKDFKAGVVDCLNGTDREPPEMRNGIYDSGVGYDAGFLFGREIKSRNKIKQEPREWSASEAYLEVCWHREGGE